MKKHFNKGIIVFFAYMLIIGFGMCNYDMVRSTAATFYHCITERYSFVEMRDSLEDVFGGKKLTYHDELMNIYSLYLRCGGTTTVKKDKNTVVRLSNGQLAYTDKYVMDEEIEESTEKINELYQYTKKSGIPYLYVACPKKGYSTDFPPGVENNVASNCDRFYAALSASQIPTLIIQEKLNEEKIDEADTFYDTDHHWKAEIGFWATGKILEDLQSRYGMSYNSYYTDISNYNLQHFEKWFLGSQGKKTGAYFTELGADDFTLITPKFKTSFVEEQPFKNEKRTGDFTQTLLFKEHIDKKDWYNKNPYATYSGGDFRLQIFSNKHADNDRKVLVIRDSFGCAVSPFLALQNKTTYLVDVRNYDYYVGEKPNIYELIDEIKPDCVLVIYEGVATNAVGRLDFD
ncbi:MAG: DHHW family protein [Lachnospiraceae bacterium]